MEYLDFREKDGYDRESVDVHLRLEGAPDGTAEPAPAMKGTPAVGGGILAGRRKVLGPAT